MLRRHLAFVAVAVIIAILAMAPTARARCKSDQQRGVAILSPLDSPNCCNPPVGGVCRLVLYYQGYMPDCPCCRPRHALGTCGRSNPVWKSDGSQSGPAADQRTDFGVYSGARHDEASLLHLGGFSSDGDGRNRPEHSDAENLSDPFR